MEFAPNFFGGGADATAAKVVAAIKADAQLGIAEGGLVANAAQVLHVHRAAEPTTPGAAQSRRLIDSDGATLQQVHEVLGGDV